MISFIGTVLIALAFGIGISLVAFGIIYTHKAFVGESVFENPFVIQGIGFAFISIGLTLLFLIPLILL